MCTGLILLQAQIPVEMDSWMEKAGPPPRNATTNYSPEHNQAPSMAMLLLQPSSAFHFLLHCSTVSSVADDDYDAMSSMHYPKLVIMNKTHNLTFWI